MRTQPQSINKLISLFAASSLMLLAAFGLVAVNQAHAQAPTTVQSPSQACATTVWACPNMTDLDAGRVGAHRLRLEGSNLPTKNEANGLPVDVHVVCGISTDEGDLFTSGNAATDKRLCIGDGTLNKMKARPYEYHISYVSGSNPFRTSDGNVHMIVKPVTNNIESHSCFFVWELPPDVVDEDGGAKNEASGDQNSLKYATFRTEGAPAACMSFRADPFGRIFNASTLKPIPGAIVSLFDFDSKQLYTLPGVTNPATTREDGLFNFNIEPGTTYLQSNLVNAPQNVHANASKAYSNIYTYGQPIVETLEKAEQRDIPVSNGNAPVLKLMDYSNLQFGDETRIEGKASWPLTLVEIKQGTQTLAQKNADEFGVFTFMLVNTLIDPAQKITVKLTEVDLTKDSNVPAEGAKTSETQIDPIPRYLEGYAYNKAGQKVPFATVQIKLKMSDQVYYETSADANAFYTVGPRYLPILPFYIEVIAARASTPGTTTSTGGTKVTIPEYAKQNKEYHEQNDIDIMAGTKNGTKVDPSAVLANTSKINTRGGIGGLGGKDLFPGSERELEELGKNQASNASGLQNRRQAGIMMMFVLIILFIVIAFGLVVYLKRKNGMGADDRGDMSTRSMDTSDDSDNESGFGM